MSPNRRSFLKNVAKILASLPLATNIRWLKFWPTKPKDQVGKFDKRIFPAIKDCPTLSLAEVLKSVQPMDGPQGTVFFVSYTKKRPWWRRIFSH